MLDWFSLYFISTQGVKESSFDWIALLALGFNGVLAFVAVIGVFSNKRLFKKTYEHDNYKKILVFLEKLLNNYQSLFSLSQDFKLYHSQVKKNSGKTAMEIARVNYEKYKEHKQKVLDNISIDDLFSSIDENKIVGEIYLKKKSKEKFLEIIRKYNRLILYAINEQEIAKLDFVNFEEKRKEVDDLKSDIIKELKI